MATDQNLVFNFLTFNHPVEKAIFSFSDVELEGYYPISKNEWPRGIYDLFPKLDIKKDSLYVNFTPNPDEKILEVNLHKNFRFSKCYYSWLIFQYFKKKAKITLPSFIKDIEVWFYDQSLKSEDYYHFKRFTIKVQMHRIVQSPELLISFEGITKVLKKSIKELNIPVESDNKVLYKGNLYLYDDLPTYNINDFDKVYPVLNHPLRSALKLPPQYKRNFNKLQIFYSEISSFVKTYIDIPEFKSIIPITSPDFINVPVETISHTSDGSNLLVFGDDKKDHYPLSGIRNNGPFKRCQSPKIEFILIFHPDDRSTVLRMLDWFNGKVSSRINLKEFLKLNYFVDIDKSIVFKNKTNPLPEIIDQLNSWPRIPGTQYFAIYITPFPKETAEKTIHSNYYKIKYELLKKGISSQTIETDTILLDSFNVSMPNIAIAILAKLGGIPWVSQGAVNNELIVGVGAFQPRNFPNRFVGSAFCFSNDGHFQGFDCYSAYSTTILAGSIRDAVVTFRNKNKQVDRLIIHFYKQMKKEDMLPIKNVLFNLNLKIPVIIVSINKTESKDIVIFDKLCPYDNMIPDSGTYVNIANNQFLLCSNTRYEDKMPNKMDGFPFPVKLTIQSTDEKIFEDKQLIDSLIGQVYQFSRMYWTSITQQNLPVTVKYPEMVAKIFPHFETDKLPDFGKINLWFL